MTDLVAEVLYVDGVVAKAGNLPLIYGTLPPMPVVGQIVVYNGSAFSGLGGWDAGVPFPSGQDLGRASVAVDPTTGDILAVLTPGGSCE